MGFYTGKKRNRMCGKDPVDSISYIDIAIEACERAIREAYCIEEVEDLAKRIQELSKQRKDIESK
mgnify:CR=1 FL=1